MGTPKGERWGGRAKGTPNALPDLRAITLKALMKAGGVEYLTRQAEENPMGFMSLLGRVMPRESHIELSAEVRIRQEVRRDLVEKLVILMKPPTREQDVANPALHSTGSPLPALAHNPDTLLMASVSQDRESLSRRGENARREGASMLSGVVQRAAAMHIENDAAASPVVSVVTPSVASDREIVTARHVAPDPGTVIRNEGGGGLPRGRPYVCPLATEAPDVASAPPPGAI